MTTPTLTPIMRELTDPPLADGVGGVIEGPVPRGGGGGGGGDGGNQNRSTSNTRSDLQIKLQHIAVQSNLAMKITAWLLQTKIPDMKLKNTFTPPTTGPVQLLELVLVAAALQ